MKTRWGFVLAVLLAAAPVCAAVPLETDAFKTSAGELKIAFVGHGSLYFTFGGKVIHVDPVSRYADYATLPKADLILVTHEHGDHLDAKTIELLSTEKTKLVLTAICAGKLGSGIVMKNGDVRDVDGIRIEAVPAYNLVHMRSPGTPYHPKGDGNGYILTFGDKRIYVAGDTENIPEMKGFGRIDVAFLPMNLPFTMTPEMVAGAARMLKPAILYPYHTGETDTAKITALLKDDKNVEVRIRRMK